MKITQITTTSMRLRTAAHWLYWGDEFAHLEFVLEKDTGTLRLYVLDGSAAGGVRLKQATVELQILEPVVAEPVKLAAVASPLSGESVGDSSTFESRSELWTRTDRFRAVIPSLNVRGSEFKNIEVQFPEGNE